MWIALNDLIVWRFFDDVLDESADTLQRKGLYPPPPGASSILGLELCGTVMESAPDCSCRDWKVGDRVMALVSGGAYAEYATVSEGSAVLIPELTDGRPLFDDVTGAAVMETWLTAYQLLFTVGGARKGSRQTVLIHAGTSGVGVAATQLCHHLGLVPLVTTRSSAKVDIAREYGAFATCDTSKEDFAQWAKGITGGHGVDLILDCVGAKYR